MATRKKLTDKTLEAFAKKPSAIGRGGVFDTLSPLLVRASDKGAISFNIYARVPKPEGGTMPARLKIGSYPTTHLEAARKKARQWMLQIEQGKDPREAERADREAQRSAEADKRATIVRVVAEDFLKRHVAKLAKKVDCETTIRTELLGQERRGGEWVDTKDERWRNRPIGEITQRDVVAVIDRIVDRGRPAQAHNALGYIKRLYSWAIGRAVYYIETSPCDRIKPVDVIGPKVKRDRVLTDAELRAVWNAAGTMRYPFGDIARMLILTGQRKSEVAEAVWSEFDLDKALWTIPAARMKADAAHVVPLSSAVVSLLKGLPRFASGDHLFSTTGGRRPVSGFSKAKTRLDERTLDALREEAVGKGGDVSKIEMAPWVLHDLRRTARTGFSAIPASDVVRELTIAHTQKGLHKVYDQYAYLDEKCSLLDAWATKVQGIIAPKPPAGIIDIGKVREQRA